MLRDDTNVFGYGNHYSSFLDHIGSKKPTSTTPKAMQHNYSLLREEATEEVDRMIEIPQQDTVLDDNNNLLVHQLNQSTYIPNFHTKWVTFLLNLIILLLQYYLVLLGKYTHCHCNISRLYNHYFRIPRYKSF